MGCDGYTTTFFYRVVFPTGKRFIPKDMMLGNKHKLNRPHPKECIARKKQQKQTISIP